MHKLSKCSIYMCLERICILYRRVVLYVCVCACVDMHAHTHTQTPIPISLKSNLLCSNLLYTYWFVSAHFFFKLLIEVVKISHYDCGLFSSSDVSLLCFLYFETFETMILGSYKIKTIVSFCFVEPFLRIFLDLKFDILLNNYVSGHTIDYSLNC